MTRRSIVAGALGAAAGVAASLIVMALLAVVVVEQSVNVEVLQASRARASAVFVTHDWTMFAVVAVAGAVVGGLFARIAIAVADIAHPEEPRLPAAPLVLLTAGLGAVVAYGTLRAGLGLGADIVGDPAAGETIVTVTVFRAIVVGMITGAATGAVTALSGEWLSRASVVGLGGEAWPATAARFVKEATAAMTIPLLAVLTVATVVFLFSRLLLLDPGPFAVIVFSLGATVVLAAAAFFAYLGGRSPTSEE